MAQQARPPVVTIMGHVDHGKTTLLDYLRRTNMVKGEAGGITQHIGAYQVEHQGKPITFIDTPGHAAFNKMRQRGAQVTDIIVLMVAANDGVKPQTIESIRHIKDSQADVIVAINKTDLPDVQPEMVKAQLAEHQLLVQGYGGEIETVEISALKGTGVDKLLETIAITAELNEYQADPDAPLRAVVIESTKDSQRGPLARVIVKQGTLRVRQDILADEVAGRVKALVGGQGEQLGQAGPGTPAEVIGFKDVPAVGAVVRDAARLEEYRAEASEAGEASEASETSEASEAGPETAQPATAGAAGIDTDTEFDFEAAFGEKEKLSMIVKTDVEGTLEVILQNIDDDSVEVVRAAVGQVSERDIEMAETTGASIITFHLKTSGKIKELAKRSGIKVQNYDVIYELIDDLQQKILKILEPTIDEVELGTAEILEVFEIRGERIAGCRMKTGQIKKTDKLHLKRGDQIVSDLTIKSMMHGKEEISSVKGKSEFGATFKQSKAAFAVGDVLVAYRVEE